MKCVLFAIVFGNSVLLQKRDAREGIRYPDCWALLGGAVEKGENIISALRREFFEEIEILDKTDLPLNAYFVGAIENEWRYFEYIFVVQIDRLAHMKCHEGRECRFYDFHNLPPSIPPHHQQAIFVVKQYICRGVKATSVKIFKEDSTMKNTVTDFVTVDKLGTVKDPRSLESTGKGYLIKKEGALTALYHNGEPMRFLGYIEFKPQKTRGDHYHKEKVENMCVVSGTIRAKYLLPDDPGNVLEIELTPGDIVHILPGCAHSYLSDNGAVALEFSPQKFSVSDTIDVDFDW